MHRSITSAAPRHPRPALALAVFLSSLLAACPGGDDPPSPPPPPPAPVVTAANDTVTLAAGQSAQLLDNDRIGSAAANAGSGGNATFTLTGTTPPTGVTVNNGSVSVTSAAVPGTVILTYRLCEGTASSNCANATATINIPAPAIVATADSFSLAAGSSGDVLANDTLGGAPATSSTVTVAATATLPSGITLSAAGLVANSSAAPGSYAVGYRICQTVAPGNCTSATATVLVPALNGTLTGRAVDAASGAGIAGVTVSVGTQSATTDSAGLFSLQGLPASSRATVLFRIDSHAEAARITSISAGSSTDVQARLVRVGVMSDVGVSSGGTVAMAGSTAQVTLPAAGVVRGDGSSPTASTMRVRVTPIDPASDTSVMPGDFSTVNAGVAAPIESFGALAVTLNEGTTGGGSALNLRSGSTATVRIPVASRNTNPPATIPLFYFDSASGRWVQEGTATLAGTAPNRYYQGTVTHFSTWNADQVMNTINVTGCVADANGNRVAGARVASDGVDYSGTSSATTDSGGNFTIAVRRSSIVTLVAQSGGLLSNTLRYTSGTADATVTTCLALGQAGAGVTMKLTWGALPSDLDSHLYTPSGSEVYYSSRGSLTSAPYANLDVDDTTSYGPEVVTLTRLMVGTYTYFIVNYSGYSGGPIASSSARVELSIPGRAVELFTPPATGETASTNHWVLFQLDVDAQCNVTVRRQGSYATGAPTRPVTGTPVYCQRP